MGATSIGGAGSTGGKSIGGQPGQPSGFTPQDLYNQYANTIFGDPTQGYTPTQATQGNPSVSIGFGMSPEQQAQIQAQTNFYTQGANGDNTYMQLPPSAGPQPIAGPGGNMNGQLPSAPIPGLVTNSISGGKSAPAGR